MRLFKRSSTIFLALVSLSGGSLAYINMLSSSIPRNSAFIPITFLEILRIRLSYLYTILKS